MMSSSSASAAAFARLVDAVMASDEIVGEVEADDGNTYRVVRRPPPGPVVTMTPLDSAFSPALEVTAFDVSDERPADYPDSLPVVPRRRVLIMTAVDGSRAHVTWTGLANAARTADEVLRQCLDDGWERIESGNPIVSLRRGGAERVLLHGAPLESGHLQMLEFAAGG